MIQLKNKNENYIDLEKNYNLFISKKFQSKNLYALNKKCKIIK